MARRDAAQEGSTGLIQSVDRALSILEIIAGAGGDMGVTELAGELGTHKSTASRLLVTLEAHGLVEADRGRYRLGLGLVGLAAAATLGLDLVKIAGPQLQAVSRATGETANLAVRDGDCALYLDQFSGAATVQANSWVGQRIPLHATSNGKVILAHAEPDVVERILAAPLDRYTPATVTRRPDLLRALAQVRDQGWAMAVDEWEEGLSAVAAPICDARGGLAGSLSISGPTFRMADRMPDLAREIVSAATTVTKRLASTT